MNTGPLTGPIDAQRYSLEAAAAAVEKADVGVEQFMRMVAADVAQTDSEVVYAENKLELHRYEPDEKRHETPIFVVYALVNRPYILDLQPDRSVIRRLLEAGFEVYLIDWGEPSRLDQSLTLADYVNRYVDNCVDVACERAGVEDVHLLGYCMGGTMSVMYAATHGEWVRTLTTMAMPIAFGGDCGILERWAAHYDPETTVEALGNIPAELLAFEFSMMDPVQNYAGKFVRLYENIEDDDFVENFARMEQWIWDGVDLSGAVYREFVEDIYQGNRLIEGEYHLGEERIDLADVDMPVQQIVGQYDHIVPPESSKQFNDEIASDDERVVEFSAGHIGISVSSSAHEELWPDVCRWLAERDASTDSSERDASTDSSERDASTDAVGGADTTADATGGTATSPATDGTAGETATPTSSSKPTADATNGGTASVEAVRGIGPTYAQRLAAAGIETVADLREYDAGRLAEIADASPSRTADWLERAG